LRLIWLVAPAALVTAGAIGLQGLPSERIVASYATSLEGRTGSQRHNARMAVEKLNGARLLPGEEFSFNKRVGTFSRDAGYRKAPVSFNGTLIDDWGGGVCQASTTLYNAVLLSGMQITERHRHQFQPSYVAPGRDAAVAFSHIDLKFKNPYSFPVRVEAAIDGAMLRVDLISARGLPAKPHVYSTVLSSTEPWTLGGGTRVRNSGKRGFEVAVYRQTGNRRELISQDSYPVMHRVVEARR
jgi:vancomycin resistance protein VanW